MLRISNFSLYVIMREARGLEQNAGNYTSLWSTDENSFDLDCKVGFRVTGLLLWGRIKKKSSCQKPKPLSLHVLLFHG